MSDNTLAIALGVGAAGGLLWYTSRRKTDPRPTAIVERPNPVPGTPSVSTEARRPPERTAPSAATETTASLLPGRWVWPVEVYQGRRSVITNPWSTNPAHVHKGVDILFPRVAGDTPTGRPAKFPPAVERWRPLVTELAGGLNVDVLLTWIQQESGGNPCATGIPGKETGLFQTYHPADDRHGATFEQLRTACVPGKQTEQRPLTDAEQRLQVATGIALVRACVDVATSALKAIGVQWSVRDRYCLAKLVHALPAYVYRFPRACTDKLGHPPRGWAELRSWVRALSTEEAIAIDPAVKPWASIEQRDRLFDNAERVGESATRGHPQFVIPEGVRALAASDGVVWSASRMPRGFTVVIDHGSYATFYTHLARLLVTPTERAASKQRVYAGQPLGVIGADPMDPAGLPHLHFELWKGGPNDAIDPGPLMRRWEHLSVSTPTPPPVAVATAMPPKPPPEPPPQAAPTSGTHTSTSTSGEARNASPRYRSVGRRGEPYPDWVRALDGKSGVYIIREPGADGKPEIVYVGSSSANRLYDTLTRHFQQWRRWKGFWKGQFAEGHDPGLTYDRDRAEVAVRITPANRALDEETRLIRRLRPRDNLIGQPEEEAIPF